MAPRARFHVRAVSLPDSREPVDWWVADGRLSAAPVDGAVDLPGAYVAPGLVDAHVHLTFEPHPWRGLAGPELLAAKLAEHRRAGVLALRDAGSVFAIDDPAVLATGEPIVVPGSPLAHLFAGVPAAEAPAAAAERARTGSGWVKFLIDVPDPSPLAPRLSYPESVVHEIGTAVHEAGGRLMTHVMGEHVALALEGGADSIEHGTFASPDELREMAARRVAWTPTLSTIAGRYLEPMGISAPLDLLRTTLPLAADVGVPILAGTDEEPPGTVAAEVAKLIEYGVPPEVAIAAATTTARAFLGLPSLEDGAPADLVTFEDATLARPTGVLSGGERIT